MNEKIKITEDELNSVRTLQVKFQEKLFQFGRLYLEKMSVEATIKSITERETQLQDSWKDLQKQENDTIEAILKKYGEGSLDVKEGVFIPEIAALSNPPK